VTLAVWVLSLGVRNADEREMILGDLLEQAAERGGGWCVREALAISVHTWARRFSAPRSSKAFASVLVGTALLAGYLSARAARRVDRSDDRPPRGVALRRLEVGGWRLVSARLAAV